MSSLTILENRTGAIELPRSDEPAEGGTNGASADRAPTGRDRSGLIHPRTASHPLDGTLDLVIPAYNEERRIGSTVEELANVITSRHLPVRLIVVDNDSDDGTATVADSIRSRTEADLSVISCPIRGKGAAVRAGVAYSTGEYVGFCDADLAVPAEVLVWAVDLLDSGWDIVVGSRRAAGAQYVKEQSLLRRLGSTAYRAASARLRGPLADTQCGFKFFEAGVARRVFEGATIDGFGFDLEILARAQRLDGVRLIEMPVPWSDQDGSTFRPVADGIQSFIDIRRARRSLRDWREAAA